MFFWLEEFIWVASAQMNLRSYDFALNYPTNAPAQTVTT